MEYAHEQKQGQHQDEIVIGSGEPRFFAGVCSDGRGLAGARSSGYSAHVVNLTLELPRAGAQ